MTAYHAKVPIVPVCIDTANNKVRMFKPTRILIGQPVPYESLGFEKGGAAEYERAALNIFDKIIALKRRKIGEDENG